MFATLHTQDTPQTIDRIIDVFTPEQQPQVRMMLSESLVGVATQTLLKRRTGGRIAALEILVGTAAVKNLIREGKTHQVPSIMQVTTGVGMQTLESNLVALVTAGEVELAEAMDRLPGSEKLAALKAVTATPTAPSRLATVPSMRRVA